MRHDVEMATGPGIAELFREHHGELVRLAVLMVGDRATAEDVVQDVYTRLYARTNRILHLAYVRAAVLNGCRSALRHRGAVRRVVQAQEALAVEAVFDSAEQTVLAAEDRGRLLTALAKLARRRREVLVLRYYLGLSEAEIAEVLGVSAGTVKSNAARGLAALAKVMGGDEP
jgi:RNA polymerase sigma-70 factor (sigma-E family)